MPGLDFSDEYRCETLDLKWLAEKFVSIAQICSDKDSKIYKEKFRLLIVFDDVAANLNSMRHDTFMSKIFYNRRWQITNCEISYLVTTQKFNALPTFIRACITHIFLFDVSLRELDDIRKEHVSVSK